MEARAASNGFFERPTEQDVRRQLEGRVEVVEAATVHLRELGALLGRWRWRRALRHDAQAIARALPALRSLPEALERIERRARSSGWADQSAVLKLSREAAALHERVLALARRRLGRFKRGFTDASLAEVLERLEAAALAPLPVEPAPGELRLLEGKLGEGAALPVWLLLVYLPALLAAFPATWAAAPIAYGLLVLGFTWAALRSGRYWLTTGRLLWRPRFGEPVEVSLASIGEGGVELQWLWGTVLVRGHRDVAVRHVEHAEKLAALLELRRLPPFRDAPAIPRFADVAVYPGRRWVGAAVDCGSVVLRPDYAAFFPEHGGGRMLAALRGEPAPPGVPIPASVVAEQLRCLDEGAFDAAIWASAEASGGSVLRRADGRRSTQGPAWEDLVLTAGEVSLHGHADWRQVEVVMRILRAWQ